MLKPRHCYSSEDAFNNALFNNCADVHAYALSANKRTQVKFLINNEKTAVCNKENKFFIISDSGRSHLLNKENAEQLLEFISIIRDTRIETYQCLGFVYDTSPSKRMTHRSIRVSLGRITDKVIDNDNLPINQLKEDPTYANRVWDGYLDRFEAILKEFVSLCEGKSSDITYWFFNDRFLMVPLNNDHNGPFKHFSLRLQWVKDNKINNIALQCGDKTVLFYEVTYVEGSSTLNEVIEGFIDSLYRLVDKYDAARGGGVIGFIESVPVNLSEDRKHFMEYVGGRGVSSDGHDNTYYSMIVNVNSDAAPAWSKTYFYYEKQFLNDLIDGLRFLVNYEV